MFVILVTPSNGEQPFLYGGLWNLFDIVDHMQVIRSVFQDWLFGSQDELDEYAIQRAIEHLNWELDGFFYKLEFVHKRD